MALFCTLHCFSLFSSNWGL